MPCRHHDEGARPLPLDLGAVTVAGLTWGTGDGETADIQICICLVKGDARARWLVVHGLWPKYYEGNLERQVLLRCEGCCAACAACAVKQASAMQGKWVVIL